VKRILVLRHGETEENLADIIQGQGQGTLTEKGRRQARAAGRRLRSRRIDRAFTSDLARARETLMEILKWVSCPWQSDVRLREGHYGEFQGRPLREYREAVEASGQSVAAFRPKNGEDYSMMRVRVKSFLEELSGSGGEETVLVVTHGGVICHLLCEIAARPLEGVVDYMVDNGSITELEIDADGSVRAVAVNDTSHLDDPHLRGPKSSMT